MNTIQCPACTTPVQVAGLCDRCDEPKYHADHDPLAIAVADAVRESRGQLPKGVTLAIKHPGPASSACTIECPGGVCDHMDTRDGSDLIHMFITGTRPFDCPYSDYERWIPAAIKRLRTVIDRLESLLPPVKEADHADMQ